MMEVNSATKVRLSRRIAKIPNLVIIGLTVGVTALITLLMMALSSFYTWSPGFTSNSEQMTLPLIIHIATVIPAVPLGGYVLLRKKGDKMHKLLGKIWAMLMMVTAISSFGLGSLGTGLFGLGLSFIHIFSVVTLISIPMAIWRIRVGDVRGHFHAMQGPYIGLIIAGLFAFMPGRLMGSLIF